MIDDENDSNMMTITNGVCIGWYYDASPSSEDFSWTALSPAQSCNICEVDKSKGRVGLLKWMDFRKTSKGGEGGAGRYNYMGQFNILVKYVHFNKLVSMLNFIFWDDVSYLTSFSAILSGKGRAVNVFHHLETTWISCAAEVVERFCFVRKND